MILFAKYHNFILFLFISSLFKVNLHLAYKKPINVNNRRGLRNTANVQDRTFSVIFPSKRDLSKMLKGVLDPPPLKYIRFYDFAITAVENCLRIWLLN